MQYAITLPLTLNRSPLTHASTQARLARLASFVDTEGTLRLSRTLEKITCRVNNTQCWKDTLFLFQWDDNADGIFSLGGKHKHEVTALFKFIDEHGTLRLSRDLEQVVAEIFWRADCFTAYCRHNDI